MANVPDELAARTTGYDTVTEYYEGNNTTSILLDNLAVRRNEDVTVTAALDNSGTGSQVTVEVQYNKMTGTETGNLIVTLLDENGQPIARQQLYKSGEEDLLKLTKEGTATATFTFEQKGASVQVEFSDLILDEGGSTELSSVSLTGAQVEFNGKDTYTATGTDLTQGVLSIVPRDPGAAITLNGAGYDYMSPTTVSLPYGETTWTITVTSGGETATYTLILDNTDPSPSGGGGGGSTRYPVSVEETEHGTVKVSPSSARPGQTVTITAQPDEGYQVGSVTVTRANGAAVETARREDGTYTFSMPAGRVTVEVTFVPQGQWVNPFRDVASGAWYYEAVRYVNERGLMAGTGSDTFSPDATTTRAMIVTILWRLSGAPVVNYLMDFSDVDPESWYGEAVRWAVSEGIASGYGGGLFGPNDPITREQLAVMLYGYARQRGYDTAARADLSGYADVGEVSTWARTALEWAVAGGLISGTSDTTLSPRGQATRAQAAQILMRFCQLEE